MTTLNFPDSPSNEDTYVFGGKTYTYNSTKSSWSPSMDLLIPTYATIDDLPASGLSGEQAFVTASNRLYLWNGSGWYNIALINTNPTISGASSSYDLATDGTPTVVTITATDPEGLPITYSIASDTSGNTATVTQGTGANTNVFTITPSTNDVDAGTFSLTFRASDGVNIASAISEFILQFKVVNSHYTTALITSVGTNNQVNNTFVDSSTNSHTITTYGNTTQATFSPYRHGGYSIFCDGVNVMNLGFSTLNSGNWTFECWALVEVGETILGKYGGGNQLEAFGVSGTTGYMYTHTNVGVETPTCNTDLRDGKWHYLVWERYNGTYYYWADGSLEASFANSETPGATGNWLIGGVASSRFKGNIREARFSLSTAVYSGSAPTTPTEPQTTSNATDAFFTGVGLEIKDYSSNNRTFTVPSTFITAPSSPYDYPTYSAGTNGGSIYFDGNGDYLSVPDDASLDLGTGDFTIEGWVWIDSASVDNAGLLGRRSQTSWNAGDWRIAYRTSGFIDFDSNLGAGPATPSMKVNSWNHFAFCKSGTTIYPFMNGSQGTPVTGYTYTLDNTEPLRIGRNSPNYDLKGNLTNIRIVKGTAVYTSDFTPPTAPLTAITNTSLLLNGTNAGIIDKSQSVKSITLNGDVKSSTTQSKYLTSSMYFDGNDYILMPDIELGSSDYTVECWAWISAQGGTAGIFSKGSPGGLSNITWSLEFSSSNNYVALYIYAANSGAYVITGSTNIITSSWNHIAVTRSGNETKLFVNGTQDGSTYTSNYTVADGGDFYLGGGFYAPTSRTITGYMSDFRVTKGLARYTANFTPPTAALQG